MKPPKDIIRFLRSAPIRTADGVDARIVQKMRAAYDGSASASMGRLGGRIVRLAVAAAILIAAGALLGHLGSFAGGNVAWADVTRRFQAVPFFSATIYMKDNATAEPTQMELWMSHEGRIRLRKGAQVVFAHGSWMQAYDIKSRRVAEPDEMARAFIEKIGQAQEFSLEAIIEVMFGGRATEVTPLINPDAVISQDVVVFDVTLPHTPEWVRIWALRESRLPVRITVWDPRDGAVTDAVFTYSREPSAEFFDAGAFEGLLQSGSAASGVNVVYAFLRDPGGRNITPEEMFQESGYRVPVVRRAGFTADGAFWVLADKARNQRPSGSVFYGFARAEDDLGRSYVRIANHYHGVDDASLSVFAPLDLPFDVRRPSRITVTCTPREHPVPGIDPASEIVGTVEIAEWTSNAPCPELFPGMDASDVSLRMELARRLAASEHAERLSRLLEVIPDWRTQPQNRGFLLFWQGMAHRRKDFQEVLAIGQVLSPLLFGNIRDASRYHFTERLVALAATGRLDEAKQLFQRVDAIPEMSPEKSDERYYATYLGILVRSLAGDGGLTLDQISQLLGFDIRRQDAYRSEAEQASRNASAVTSQKAAQDRLSELAAWYDTHPLPEKAELLERSDGKSIYLAGTGNDLPGHPGYKVLPINYAVSGVVSNLRGIDADRSDARKVHPYLAAIRFAEGAQDRELRADLVYRAGIELGECFRLALAACGLELTTETLPARPVLIARCDGRKLRGHTEVYGPWHVDDGDIGTRTWRAADLLESLSQQIGTGVYLVDETGLDSPLCLGDGTPRWEGDQGFEQASRWLQEQFGVTLVEEARPVETYLIQRRTQ